VCGGLALFPAGVFREVAEMTSATRRMTDVQLLAEFRRYQEEFRLVEISRKHPKATDTNRVLNAAEVFSELCLRGLVDKNGRERTSR